MIGEQKQTTPLSLSQPVREHFYLTLSTSGEITDTRKRRGAPPESFYGAMCFRYIHALILMVAGRGRKYPFDWGDAVQTSKDAVRMLGSGSQDGRNHTRFNPHRLRRS